MKNEHYITILGFMRNELNLKGNELMVYALIYGFSQDDESEFTGSISYIAEWIGSTKQTVHNVLKSLSDKGLINKTESYRNGIKFCSYKTIIPVVKNFDGGWSKNLTGGGQKIRPNNIDNIIKNTIDYLNTKAGTGYKSTSKITRNVIKARLEEKFTEEDFKKVIDKKVKQWKGTKMEEFLRPQTLFGNKFESYLNQHIVDEKVENKQKRYPEFKQEKSVDSVEMPDEIRQKISEIF